MQAIFSAARTEVLNDEAIKALSIER